MFRYSTMDLMSTNLDSVTNLVLRPRPRYSPKVDSKTFLSGIALMALRAGVMVIGWSLLIWPTVVYGKMW